MITGDIVLDMNILRGNDLRHKWSFHCNLIKKEYLCYS